MLLVVPSVQYWDPKRSNHQDDTELAAIPHMVVSPGRGLMELTSCSTTSPPIPIHFGKKPVKLFVNLTLRLSSQVPGMKDVCLPTTPGMSMS